MAYTQVDVDALETAIKSGVLSVRYRERETTYRSLNEMQALLVAMKRQVSSAPPGPRHQVADFSGDHGA